MKAVNWNPDILIARREGMQSSLAHVITIAKRNSGMRIRMERSEGSPILGSRGCVPASKAQFREGCIKAVELGIAPLPERAGVMAEIHRRIDRLTESDDGSLSWQANLLPILHFAGAWALAARLMQAGLSVLVHEEEAKDPLDKHSAEVKVDVELVIPRDCNGKET